MHLQAFSASCLLVAATAAQVVVPSAAATNRPDCPNGNAWYTANVWYSTSSATIPHDSHAQLIYDVSDVMTPAGLWNSLDYRRPGLNQQNTYLGNVNNAGTTNATIILSWSTTALANVTNTFATNVGGSPVTVLSGMVNLPAGPAAAIWPHPWNNIPFTTPYVWIRPPTGTLVVDILQTGNTSTSAWYLEMQGPNNGGRSANGNAPSTCKNSALGYANSIGYSGTLMPGGQWYVSYGGLPNNAPGFAWIGSQGIGGTYGGLLLPIDLGVIGAPGCFIHASVDYAIPLTAAGTSARWPTIQLPNDPSLAGAFFYDHSIWLDAAANALGAVVGWSSRWGIGTGLGAPAAMVSATGTSAMNATGSLAQQTGVTLRFNP